MLDSKFFFRIENYFLIFSLLFGLFLIIFTPPLQSPDEPAHFSRAYSISEGHILAKKLNNVSGDFVPASLLNFENELGYLTFKTNKRISFEKIRESSGIIVHKSDKVFSDQKYQALYSPLAYFPQSIGIFFAKYFTDSVYWLLFFSKLAMLAFYTIMGYFSIKSIPFLKSLLFLILLMPMSLSMGASVSADGILICLSVFYFSKILQYTYSNDNISFKQYLLMMFLAFCLAMVKQSFFLTLFLLFIPLSKFNNLKFIRIFNNNIFKVLILLIPAFIGALIWSKLSYNLFVPLNNSNPEIQIQFILSHPFVYLKTLYSTLYLNFIILLYETVGILGWLDVFLFPVTYWIYWLFLVLNIFFCNSAECRVFSSLFQRILLFGLVLFNIIFISTIIYVSWIQPYVISPFEGLQGRYFIPLLLPFFTFLFLIGGRCFGASGFSKIMQFNILLVFFTYMNLAFGLYIRYYSTF
ncbi:MAG: DUF2142 domain-containing protein [Clostridium sp.]|nr:DUF2142 domain-containing protein [Clostridium sp.]